MGIAVGDPNQPRESALVIRLSSVGKAMCKLRDERNMNLVRPSLDQIIDKEHPHVRFSREIDWDFFDQRFRSICRSGAG